MTYTDIQSIICTWKTMGQYWYTVMDSKLNFPQIREDDRVDVSIVSAVVIAVFLISVKSMSMSIALAIVLTTTFLLHQMWWRRRHLPPGPTPFPFIGNTLSLNLRHPAEMFTEWHAQFGSVFTVWLPQPMVVLASHDALQEALIKQGQSFSGRPMGYLWTMFTKNTEFGDGIILCEGKRWHEIREFAHKIFRNFGLGKTMMEERIVNHISSMIDYIGSKFDGEEIVMDIERPISLCVANIIQDIIMGKSYKHGDKRFESFKNMIDTVLKEFASRSLQIVNAYPFLGYFPFLYSSLKRYRENGFRLSRFFLHEIHEHKQHLVLDGEPRDFMEAFLREMKYSQKGNPNFTVQTLAIAAGDLWTGGMETTVTTIRWAIIYMLYYPKVQAKCQAEIDKVFGTEQPSYAHRKEMPYVEATIAEVQRVVNVLPWAIPHRTIEDAVVGGFQIPKGTIVLPQYGTVMFDPHYFPDPESFQPERFIDENGYFKKRPEMNPFGMGKRTCLGENLARYELFLLFTTLLQRFEFKPISGKQLPSLARSEGMTNVPQAYSCLVRRRGYGIAPTGSF